MIRERISTQGIIRPLEPEAELDAFQIPNDMIGGISELIIRRYNNSRSKFDTKFASSIKAIEKHRRQNLQRSKKDTIRNMAVLQNSLETSETAGDNQTDQTKKGIKDGLIPSSGSWSWAWALDGLERPPPSSIVSRRDTGEARRLANIADQSVLQEENVMNANNLWSVIVNFLTVAQHHKDKVQESEVGDDRNEVEAKQDNTVEKRKSTFSRFLSAKAKAPTHLDNIPSEAKHL